MNAYEQNGIIYVPRRATDETGAVGDGYVPLSTLPEREQQSWLIYLATHAPGRLADTLSPTARRARDKALAQDSRP